MTVDHDSASETVALASGAELGEGPDLLSDVLHAVRLNGSLFFLVDATSPWVAEAPAGDVLAPVLLPRAQRIISFHVVQEGRCWCEVPGESPIELETGDVVVLPHGDPYALTDVRGARASYTVAEGLEWFGAMVTGKMPLVSVEGGGGHRRIGVLCGFLGCDALPFNPVLATLPRALHLPRPRNGGPDRLAPLVDLLVSEARNRREGRRTMLLRIGELLFVEVVRRHLMAMRPGATGWLAGLSDRVVGGALAALHAEPARAWTLEDVARCAGCSRSALAERFATIVGQPPMQYLARWRLQLAASLLESGDTKVAAIAHEVGYESEAAFSRAFKRLVGRSPSAWRASPSKG